MRYRWDKRFAKSDLPVTWAIDLANLPALPQRSILHALRLLQEALINAFKHAKADHVVVAARYDAAIDGLTLSVRDDGVGLQQSTKGGRGIHNMQQRAREIGGTFQIRSHQPGTEVLLTVSKLTLLTV